MACSYRTWSGSEITYYVEMWQSGCNSASHNPIYHSKMKHIDLESHYIQGIVGDGVISMEYCPTKQHAIDIFTKSLIEEKYVYLSYLFGMREFFIKGKQ